MDVRLGVIEKVPVNVPFQWCSRMIVQPKSNGEPRRVVDYQQLNDQALRQPSRSSPYLTAGKDTIAFPSLKKTTH